MEFNYVFDERPPVGYAGSVRIWCEEIIPVINHVISKNLDKVNKEPLSANIEIRLSESFKLNHALIYDIVMKYAFNNNYACSVPVLGGEKDNFYVIISFADDSESVCETIHIANRY